MRKVIAIIMLIALALCTACNSFAENKEAVISGIVNGLTDSENGQSCRYNETDNILLYEIELPITYDNFQSRSVGEIEKYYEEFQSMAKYLKESVVEPFIQGTTSALIVVSLDRIHIAVFVGTTDLLHSWF